MEFHFPRSFIASCAALILLGGICAPLYSKYKVVAFVPANGEFAEIGWTMQAGYSAMQEIEQNPLPFDLTIEDCSDSVQLHQKLETYSKDSDVVALLGGMPGEASLQIAEYAQSAGIPYVVDCCADDTLTSFSSSFVFRIIPPLSDFNDGIVSWAATVAGRGRLSSILYDTSPHYFPLKDDLESDLRARWEGNSDWLPFEHGENDFSEFISHLKATKPALVWLLGNTLDIARFLRQCRKAEYMPYAFVFANDEMAVNRMISASEKASEFVLAPHIWVADQFDPKSRKFVEVFRKRFGESPDYRAAACASGLEVLISIFGDKNLVGREQVRLELSEREFDTVFDRVLFENITNYTNQNRAITYVYQQIGDSWLPVWPEEVAKADDVYPVPDWRERKRKPVHNAISWKLWILAGAGSLVIALLIGFRDVKKG